MTTGFHGTWHRDNNTDMNAAKFNQHNPPGHVYNDPDAGDTGLQCSVGAANWLDSSKSEINYAGSNNNTLSGSTDTWVWINSSGVLQLTANLTSLAADDFVCAKVTTSGSAITAIHPYYLPASAFGI